MNPPHLDYDRERFTASAREADILLRQFGYWIQTPPSPASQNPYQPQSRKKGRFAPSYIPGPTPKSAMSHSYVVFNFGTRETPPRARKAAEWPMCFFSLKISCCF